MLITLGRKITFQVESKALREAAPERLNYNKKRDTCLKLHCKCGFFIYLMKKISYPVLQGGVKKKNNKYEAIS